MYFTVWYIYNIILYCNNISPISNNLYALYLENSQENGFVENKIISAWKV